MSEPSEILMLGGVVATCADCGDERLFVPTAAEAGEYCCTSCDAAVFLLTVVQPTHRDSSRVA